MFFPTYPRLEKTGHDRSATSLSRFPHSTQLQPRLLRNSCNRQPRSTCNRLRFGSVAGLLSVRQPDFKTLISLVKLLLQGHSKVKDVALLHCVHEEHWARSDVGFARLEASQVALDNA